MPEPGLGGRKRLLCLLALVATFSVVAMSSSLTWPILAESLRLQGYDETAIGLNAAAQFAGIIFTRSVTRAYREPFRQWCRAQCRRPGFLMPRNSPGRPCRTSERHSIGETFQAYLVPSECRKYVSRAYDIDDSR